MQNTCSQASYILCNKYSKILDENIRKADFSIIKRWQCGKAKSISCLDPDGSDGISSTVLEFLNNLWGARNRVGIGLSYRHAKLHGPAELIPWSRFLGSLKV